MWYMLQSEDQNRHFPSKVSTMWLFWHLLPWKPADEQLERRIFLTIHQTWGKMTFFSLSGRSVGAQIKAVKKKREQNVKV